MNQTNDDTHQGMPAWRIKLVANVCAATKARQSREGLMSLGERKEMGLDREPIILLAAATPRSRGDEEAFRRFIESDGGMVD